MIIGPVAWLLIVLLIIAFAFQGVRWRTQAEPWPQAVSIAFWIIVVLIMLSLVTRIGVLGPSLRW